MSELPEPPPHLSPLPEGEADATVPGEEEKQLRTTSFVVHATRGVIRDQTMRRKTMFVLLVIALLMLFAGSTFLQSTLSRHEHPFAFIVYWFVCAWLTLSAMLLAFFDMLVIRTDARKAAKILRDELSANRDRQDRQ